MAELLAAWTGRHADALRQALRLSNEGFAEHLGVAARTVAYWRQRPDLVPRPGMQQILDTALARAPEQAQAHFWQIIRSDEASGTALSPGAVLLTGGAPLAPGPPLPEAPVEDDADAVVQWLTTSGTRDTVISGLGRAAYDLAAIHAWSPPAEMLAWVRATQRAVHDVLQTGRLRHSQQTDLLVTSGALLAHASLLLSDLGDHQAAHRYGHASRVALSEAGASVARSWYVLAKVARWRQQYSEAAQYAALGLYHAQGGPMRAQLAAYQANTAALAGDIDQARAAMAQAESAFAAVPADDLTASPWSFPPGRMTIFRLSVALAAGDPDAALRAADEAGPSPAAEGANVPAAWAQTRAGAAIARLLKDDLDGAAAEVAPMLPLAPELRITTVTGWLTDLQKRLSAPRFAGSPTAVSLRQEIREAVGDAPDAESEVEQEEGRLP